MIRALLVVLFVIAPFSSPAQEDTSLNGEKIVAGLSQNRVSYLEQHPEELSFKQLLAWCAVIGLELRLGERDSTNPPNRAEW